MLRISAWLKKGKLRIEWAFKDMPVFGFDRQDVFEKDKPLKGLRIVAACFTMYGRKPAIWPVFLKPVGARCFDAARSNPLSQRKMTWLLLLSKITESRTVVRSKAEDTKTYLRSQL